MEIAKNILSQLGGNRFIAMTGANNLIGGNNMLSFKVGRNDKGVTHVRITLTAMDDYTVEFLRIRGTSIKTVNTTAGVYCDNLRRVFETETGLRTSLGGAA